jgi:hypothetical protein
MPHHARAARLRARTPLEDHKFSTPVVHEVPRPADPDFPADRTWSTS